MPKEENNEVDKFFKDLPTENKDEADIFGAGPAKEPEAPKPEEDEEPHKNRRHRRLEAQLEAEREARIRLETQLEARSEVDQFRQETTLDEDTKDLLRLYGDNEQGRQAVELTKNLLDRVSTRTKEQTLRELRDEQRQEQEEEKRYEQVIDSSLESLEDQYNVDLTSDSPSARRSRREFLEMVQALSPKDENGIITGYADFESTFEIYQDRQKSERPDNTRNKEVAARSMERSAGNSGAPRKAPTPGFDGWKADYGLN